MNKLNNTMEYASITAAIRKLNTVVTDSDKEIMSSGFKSIRYDQDLKAMNSMESVLRELAEHYGMKAEVSNIFNFK